MRYAIVKYVDKWSQIPCDKVKCFSPSLPNIKGLKLIFTNRAEWPTPHSKYYITCDDDANLNNGGVIKELTEKEFDEAKSFETDAYATVIRKERDRLLLQAQNKLEKAIRLEAMGETHEPIHAIQNYIQALANVPQQENFPWEYSYPNYEDFLDSIPSSVTIRQIKLALIDLDLIDTVESAIESITDNTQKMVFKTEWNNSNTIKRNSEWADDLRNLLEFTEEQFDDLFKKAVEF